MHHPCRSLFAVLVAILFCAASSRADKPNVVIVITDDQGYGDLSCHGNLPVDPSWLWFPIPQHAPTPSQAQSASKPTQIINAQ